ncbi:MAG: response regulator [Acidobacteriota bacterium]
MAGIPVETAVDGEDALAKLDEYPISLVLTDLMMPKVDGFGLLKTLAATGRYPPVIVPDSRRWHRRCRLGSARYAGVLVLREAASARDIGNADSPCLAAQQSPARDGTLAARAELSRCTWRFSWQKHANEAVVRFDPEGGSNPGLRLDHGGKRDG